MSEQERRRFSRIMYQAPAELHQGKVKATCSIRDLSLHGLLLSSPSEQLDESKPVDIFFHIPESDIIISLQAEIIALNNKHLRAKIQHIDIDSICHLRRLVELNVGDEQMLHREIEQLSDLDD